MALTIYTRYAYPISTAGPFPVVVLMHGFTDAAANFTQASIERIANLGFFVLVPGMRGRDGYGDVALRDASGREIHDIYDAVVYARSIYPTKASSTIAAIVGYSGGGGNALAAACKFPDFWSVVVSHFGMSDYGYNNPSGWWYQNPDPENIEAYVGGTPAAVPNNYRARNAREGIVNYTGGHVYLFHDDGDTSVPINQSQLLQDAMAAAGLTNVTESYTTVTDDPRWTHGYPTDGEDIVETEDVWAPAVLSSSAWTIPASGTITVIGYIVTKRFSVWLNANGTATTGIDAAATVVYNTATDTYTVTPLTGAIDVSITQGSKTGSASNISEATAVVVS